MLYLFIALQIAQKEPNRKQTFSEQVGCIKFTSIELLGY